MTERIEINPSVMLGKPVAPRAWHNIEIALHHGWPPQPVQRG